MDAMKGWAQGISGGASCACGWHDFDLGWPWRLEYHQKQCSGQVQITSAKAHREQVEFAAEHGTMCYCGQFEDRGPGWWERYQEHRKVCVVELAAREAKLTNLVSFLEGASA